MGGVVLSPSVGTLPVGSVCPEVGLMERDGGVGQSLCGRSPPCPTVICAALGEHQRKRGMNPSEEGAVVLSRRAPSIKRRVGKEGSNSGEEAPEIKALVGWRRTWLWGITSFDGFCGKE